MAGDRGTEKRRLPGQVLVRLTVEAAAAVDAHAAARNLSRAAWVRDVVADAAALPVEDRRPERPRRRKQPPARDVAEMGVLSRKLGKHNGAVVQLSKALRLLGEDALHHRAEATLTQCEDAARRVVRLVERLERLDRLAEKPG